MSFTTKVTFVPRDSGIQSVPFEKVDYDFGNYYSEITSNLKEKFREYNFKESNETGSYFDFVCLLSMYEFKKFHSLYFDSNPLSDLVIIDEFLTNKLPIIKYNWVIIEIFEIDF